MVSPILGGETTLHPCHMSWYLWSLRISQQERTMEVDEPHNFFFGWPSLFFDLTKWPAWSTDSDTRLSSLLHLGGAVFLWISLFGSGRYHGSQEWKTTPLKSNMENTKIKGLVSDVFSFSKWVIFRFQPLVFFGVPQDFNPSWWLLLGNGLVHDFYTVDIPGAWPDFWAINSIIQVIKRCSTLNSVLSVGSLILTLIVL